MTNEHDDETVQEGKKDEIEKGQSEVQQKSEHMQQEKNQVSPQKKAKKRGWGGYILLLCLGLVGYFFYTVIFSCDYTARTRVAEGLVLASSAKNLVVDNAVNGFPLSRGWTSPSSTVNTKLITIDEQTGVITITGTSKAEDIVLTLTPTGGEGMPLVVGVVPQGRISWQCKVLSFGSSRGESDVPAECRN